MKKKIIISSLIILSIICFLCFKFYTPELEKKVLYDVSPSQGSSTNKGHFIPEQKTDYIFTTIHVELGFNGIVILVLLITSLIVFFIRKRLKNKFKS